MAPNSQLSTVHMSEKRDIDARSNSCVQNTKQADFDTAIAATGQGKFHILLYLAIIPVSWASSVDTANISMILPAAECDLQLTLFHKGILNAAIYIGMVMSGILWGYLADVKGRKSIIIYGFLADGICNILLGFSQNFEMLVFFKYVIGCIISGPYATSITYYSEFFSTKSRSRITLILGSTITVGAVVNVGLAWLIIPQKWSIVLGDGYFVYNSWRIFLSLCSVPTLIGVFCLSFFPESPKFLMSQGRKEEAMKVLRKIYSINTGQPEDTYPIAELIDEGVATTTQDPITGELKIKKKTFRDGLLQMKPIFFKPHVCLLLLMVTLQFCSMLGLNTIRLWQPQMFAILGDFDPIDYNITDHVPGFCEILDAATAMARNTTLMSSNVDIVKDCSEVVIAENMYIGSMIVSATSIAFLSLASLLVNLLGHKNLLYICYTICVTSLVSMAWSTNSILTLGLTCLYVGIMNTTLNIIIGAAVMLFPTSLRTMAVSLEMIMGRFGSLIGNVVFPVLLQQGCMTPIMVVACFPLLGIILSFFIPKQKGNVEDVKSGA